jgi:hypothetical protein
MDKHKRDAFIHEREEKNRLYIKKKRSDYGQIFVLNQIL